MLSYVFKCIHIYIVTKVNFLWLCQCLQRTVTKSRFQFSPAVLPTYTTKTQRHDKFQASF